MGRASVISAERFARERVSYWSQLLPRMDAFVRAVNIGSTRFSPPIAKHVAANRRAFVAELAFELLKGSLEDSSERRDQEVLVAAVERVRPLVARLGQDPISEVAPPTSVELSETQRLLANLLEFVGKRPGQVEISPVIAGCGIVDRCTADILIARAMPEANLTRLQLYEVKMVSRSFRASDLRQLLTYAALMLAERRQPQVVGLVNPRLGVYFECELDALCIDTAGVPAGDLLESLIFEFTSGEVSL